MDEGQDVGGPAQLFVIRREFRPCQSGALAALDLACKELVSGTSDLVLCGGVDLHNSINDYLMFAAVRALAPNGRE